MKEFYKGKNILVAGGTGTIGVATVNRLVSMGANVTVVSVDSRDRFNAVLDGAEVFFIRKDLTDLTNCKNVVEGFDYVFNMICVKGNTQAGESQVASTFIPLLMVDTNLMEAARLAGVKRFMFVSSICAYPNIPVRHEDSVWDGPPHANDRFAGIAKRVGEAQSEAYMMQYGWDATRVVRLSNVYGPYDDFDPKTAHVIPALISRAVNGENPIKVAGDGKAERDFIYLDDVVDGILNVMENAPPCVPINLGCGYGIPIKEIVDIIVSQMDKGVTVEWDSDRPTGDLIRILDTNRAKELVNFEPNVNIRDGIIKTIEWYKSNRDIADKRGEALHGG